MLRKVNDISEPVIVIDKSAVILKINSKAADLFEYTCKELIGHKIQDILPFLCGRFNKRKRIVLKALNDSKNSSCEKGLKKSGLLFPIDLLISSNEDGTYSFIVRDNTEKYFKEQIETMTNAVLQKILQGEKFEQFSELILDYLKEIFLFPLIWMGQYEKKEKAVLVLFSAGEASYLAPPKTLFGHSRKITHPCVLACERQKVVSDDVKDKKGELYKMMAFPILSENKVMGVLNVLVPNKQFKSIILKYFEKVTSHLGKILKISEEQKFSRLLSTAVSSAMGAVFITDRNGDIIWVNEAFSRLTGYCLNELIGTKTRFSRSVLNKEMQRALKAGCTWRGETVERNKDGSLFTIEQMIIPVLDGQGCIEHYVVLYDKSTVHKDEEREMTYVSNYDQLTGLPNRHFFHKKLKQILLKTAESHEIVAVLFIDVSNFSCVNDTLGHVIGDRILKIMADRISLCITPNDVIARINGDEFAVILRNVKQPDDAGRITQKIIHAIQEPIRVDKNEIVLGSYVGIALFPDDTTDPDKLINYADMTLFKAKKTAQNSYFFFSPQLNKEMEERLELEQDLRKAFSKKEFFLNFQPQIELETGCVSGWEALIRWKHPQKGLISPNLFISVAEDTGLIIPLFEFVLKEAAKQLRKWNKMGYNNIKMAVNVSAIQFENPEFKKSIQDVLKKYHITTKSFELELTESLLMKEDRETQEILTTLSDNGVCIAIDDFGTGYSSFNYLRRLPVNKLKIDKSFIKDVDASQKNKAIVEAIISLGHILGLQVVAEGIENVTQLRVLKKLGCDFVQGFFLSVPLNEKEATAFLQERNRKCHL